MTGSRFESSDGAMASRPDVAPPEMTLPEMMEIEDTPTQLIYGMVTSDEDAPTQLWELDSADLSAGPHVPEAPPRRTPAMVDAPHDERSRVTPWAIPRWFHAVAAAGVLFVVAMSLAGFETRNEPGTESVKSKPSTLDVPMENPPRPVTVRLEPAAPLQDVGAERPRIQHPVHARAQKVEPPSPEPVVLDPVETPWVIQGSIIPVAQPAVVTFPPEPVSEPFATAAPRAKKIWLFFKRKDRSALRE